MQSHVRSATGRYMTGAYLLLALCAACGAKKVSGTIGGKNITINEAVYAVTNANDTGGGVLVFGETTGLCGKIVATEGDVPANFKAFRVLFTNPSAAVGKGTYTVVVDASEATTPYASAVYNETDAKAELTAEIPVTAGTLKIDSLAAGNGNHAQMTFDFTLQKDGSVNSDRVSGSVSALWCDGLAKLYHTDT